jgi:hypothetical protein
MLTTNQTQHRHARPTLNFTLRPFLRGHRGGDVPLERSRREISIPPHLTAWKSIDCGLFVRDFQMGGSQPTQLQVHPRRILR